MPPNPSQSHKNKQPPQGQALTTTFTTLHNHFESSYNPIRESNRMCTIIISKIHWRGCTSACDTTTRRLLKCAAAETSGTQCEDTKESHSGQTTRREQCPNHRDEGFSQR
ncbi:hypothetical protein CEP51_015969 [Fusarium floridanum]|uniref:Uncharacterized protein n=1 Tax=Fusarium floridanum TaxID=1325733 RepID=A0A428NZS7_9HYPO|nr:hypothetical protein CEP51_015969 [Fusarium floridanum]